MIIMRGVDLSGGGGAERRFARVAKHARSQGIEVILAVNHELSNSLAMAGVIDSEDPVLYAPTENISILQFNKWLIQVVHRFQPDVLHLPLFQKSLIPFYIWLTTRNKTPFVQTVATTALMDNEETISERLLVHYLLQRATLIDALYPRFTSSVWGYKYKNKIRMSPCSFSDYNLYHPALQKENVILYAGRFIRQKNPLLLLDGVRHIMKEDPTILSKWNVLMMGCGSLQASMENIIHTNKLDKIITIASTPNIVDYIRQASIFVSLQCKENYPSQSLIEAMACEAAIIATDVGNTDRLVTDEVGILIPPTGKALSEAIRKLITNNTLRKTMGINARKKVVTDHTIERFGEYVLHLWEEAVRT